MTDRDCQLLYEDAAFYDREFATRDHEIPFYRRLCARTYGPILEVACGTGRLTIPLAQEGHDIAGLDASPSMLERARVRAGQLGLKISWMHQDCTAMEVGRQFALIFCATNAMQHLLTGESVDGFLQRARRHLLPGGNLVLDVFNPDPKKLARGPDDRYHHKSFVGPDGAIINVDANTWYCSDLQQLHFTLTYHQEGRELKVKKVSMRCFFPEELRAICRHNGLSVTERFGDYDERPFSAAAPKQILICRDAATRPGP